MIKNRIYNIAWLKEEIASCERIKYLTFWGHTHAPDQVNKACFSQWYSSPFVVAGRKFATAEHWMMAEKAKLFGDIEVYERVFLNDKPGAAKACGRQVKNFVQDLWNSESYEIVVTGNYHKFSQHPKLKAFLLGTHDRVLIEASPVDPIWGIGLAADDPNVENPDKWQGTNLLGFALMEVRKILKSE